MLLPKLPDGVNFILSTLENAGHTAYAVGGCVRDILRGVTPDDYDITTSALPDEVLALFGNSAIPTGLKHGTVTVKSYGTKCEVTTYRAEGEYTDHRRPDVVRFVSSLADDLSRRDFTMNAIALSLRGEFIDLFGGCVDIKNKVIRSVGNAETRFSEDALRMLRALRFSAVLGFEIEVSTLEALKNCAPLARHLAAERIAAELSKALLGENMRPVEQMFSLGLMNEFLEAPCTPDFSSLASLPRDINLRLCAMCFTLEKLSAIETEEFLRTLRSSNETIKLCSLGVKGAHSTPSGKTDWKRLVSRIGISASRCAAAALVTEGKDNSAVLDEIENSGECCSLSTIAINGEDIKALGLSGRDISLALRKALDYVIENPDRNEKSILLEFIERSVTNDK